MRRPTALLLLILAAGLLVRAGYLAERVQAPDFDAPLKDAAFHDYWARALSGEGYCGATNIHKQRLKLHLSPGKGASYRPRSTIVVDCREN